MESVVISVKGEVVEVEKSEPKLFGDSRVTANGVVLIGDPHDQNDVEGGGGVLEELGHDRLHA